MEIYNDIRFTCNKFCFAIHQFKVFISTKGYSAGSGKSIINSWVPLVSYFINQSQWRAKSEKWILTSPVWDNGGLQPKNDCLIIKDLQHCRPMSYTHSISIKCGKWAQDCVLTPQQLFLIKGVFRQEVQPNNPSVLDICRQNTITSICWREKYYHSSHRKQS